MDIPEDVLRSALGGDDPGFDLAIIEVSLSEMLPLMCMRAIEESLRQTSQMEDIYTKLLRLLKDQPEMLAKTYIDLGQMYHAILHMLILQEIIIKSLLTPVKFDANDPLDDPEARKHLREFKTARRKALRQVEQKRANLERIWAEE